MKSLTQIPPTFQVPNAKKLHVELMGESKSVRRALNSFISLSKKYKTTYISQRKIGSILGYSRQTMNKAVGRLCELGWIAKHDRYWKTCYYYVAPYWNHREIREKLYKILPALWFFSLGLLGVLTMPSTIRQKFTLYNKRYTENNLFYNTSAENWSLKKQVVMQEDVKKANGLITVSNPIRSDIVKFAKRFGFSVAGMAKLMAFERECLADTVERFGAKIAQARDRHAYFCKLAMEWYKLRNKSPDWLSANRLQLRFNLTDEAPRMLEKWEPEKGDAQVIQQSVTTPKKRIHKDVALGGNTENPTMPKIEIKLVQRPKITERPVLTPGAEDFWAQMAKNVPQAIIENENS